MFNHWQLNQIQSLQQDCLNEKRQPGVILETLPLKMTGLMEQNSSWFLALHEVAALQASNKNTKIAFKVKELVGSQFFHAEVGSSDYKL